MTEEEKKKKRRLELVLDTVFDTAALTLFVLSAYKIGRSRGLKIGFKAGRINATDHINNAYMADMDGMLQFMEEYYQHRKLSEEEVRKAMNDGDRLLKAWSER